MLKVCVNSAIRNGNENLNSGENIKNLTLVIVAVTQHLQETIFVCNIFELRVGRAEIKQLHSWGSDILYFP